MNALIEKIQASLLDLVGEAVKILPGLVLALVILLLTRFAANLARRAARKVGQRALNSLSLQSLVVHTAFVATWIVGIILACILAFPGFNLASVVALLGLGSVAVGFAFQDIFKNFLAGVLLLLQEPFSIGDQIIVSDFEGTVEEIALRSTQIRTYAGEQVVMPNSIVFTSPVQVLTARPQRRTDLAIGVDYNTPLPKAVDVLFQAVQTVDEVGQTPSPEIDIVGFGDSSIDLMVRYWTQPEMKVVRRVRTQVMIALKQACDAADINIPYPIRTLYYYNQEKFNDYLTNDAHSASGE
ncbi:mechanosensitive ion channel family protein [Romeria aff. gracilis LEGE 07310]|uniref:Mechanosensitive ion channel family protein n=1 Tax=Vasconcelosia minhoensis LEGE 07310 TaxID=915328 RepID=A0A8J7ALU6_9CYAN|nr:mechanosensitive ion channel family protein [Romeria gracilis]MBE9077370.1 mechanosensitive ion channel family protein [Romeria aff. gracilis LEGE 07310]